MGLITRVEPNLPCPPSGRIGEKDFKTKQLFDGNGGIIGMEDHKWDSDGWTRTPGSVAPDTQADYAQGANGMDRNVFADGYKFPHY